MSRFVDPTRTKRVDLGECLCPGTPHPDGDYALVRSELSGEEIATYAAEDDRDTVAEMAAGFVTEWNFLGPDGKPWPVTGAAIKALMAPTMTAIAEAISETVTASVALPNASGARSAGSSRASASRTRTSRPRR